MLYTFGSPRVGDKVFAEHFSKAFSFPYFRVVHNNDIVPMVPLPYMDLRPEILLIPGGGPAKLLFALFNPVDDPFAHIGKFIHLRKMPNGETFVSKLEEQAFHAVLPSSLINPNGKITIDMILPIKSNIDDHDLTKCYCQALRANMMKSILSYLGSNMENVEKLENESKGIENEILELENNTAIIMAQRLEQSKEQYLLRLNDRMIQGKKKYLSEYKSRVAHYKQLDSNRSVYLKELMQTTPSAAIENELKFQKSLI